MRNLIALLIAIASSGCIDRIPSRVQIANRAAISFLLKYAKTQNKVFASAHHFDQGLGPLVGNSQKWTELAPSYAVIRSQGYVCRFEVKEVRFAVTCLPGASSGLRISFYVDERRRITLSSDGAAGPASPEVRLTDQEKHQM
jgi:hypothetical protein